MIVMLSFSLFPRGFMPARTASGGFTIVLCSASGLTYTAADAPAEAPRRHIGSQKCDLVGAAAVMPPAVALQAPLVMPLALSQWSVRAFALRFVGVFDPNAPPTAPPLLTL